ncbi:hypothetical protein [Acinetobacter sp. YH12239]|uniref:hypothetical protein n=1 Tax=Acinetobacter sp. YH12239 TaxID=2601166 RepID=UPI0015D1DA04|nr:hypothetical protein [Acinetobacter sp. YH12239]
MKKFELINKSILFVVIFIMLPFWSYQYYGYLIWLIFGFGLSILFWLLARKNYNNKYFIFLFLNVFIIFLLAFGAIYLTSKDGWQVIFKYLFLILVVDFLLSFNRIKRGQRKFKENNFINGGNLDDYSYNFELTYGKVWGDGLFFQIVLFLYMLFIGPYYIVINSPFEFYAGEMMEGIKSNLSVYAIILMILLFWEYALKRFYFFSGLNYKFDNK